MPKLLSFNQFIDPKKSCKIAFVGDIMQHEKQLEFESSRNFSYDKVFDNLSELFNGLDLVIGNLETVIKEGKISGYPNFCSPPELLYSLKKSGFDSLITCNNHSLDHDEEGVKSTFNFIESSGMIPIGSMGQDKKTFDVKGNKITIHAYTTFFNGDKKSDNVSTWNEKSGVKKSDGINIAYIHSGKQYDNTVTPEQNRIGKELKESGFDGVISTHSHVPGDLIYDEDGFFCIYGMGNFISDQKDLGVEQGNCVIFEVDGGKIQSIDILVTESVVDDDGKTIIQFRDETK